MSVFILVDVNSLSVLDSKAWHCLDPISLLEAENRAHKTPFLHPKKQFQDPLSYPRTSHSCINFPTVAGQIARGRGLGASAEAVQPWGRSLLLSCVTRPGDLETGRRAGDG